MKLGRFSYSRVSSPKPLGAEVKSATFSLSPKGPSSLESLNAAVTEWLRNEVAVELDSLGEKRDFQVGLLDEAGNPGGIFYKETFDSDKGFATQLTLVTNFYRGIETSTVRIIESQNQTLLEVSTTIHCEDPTQSLQLIPRAADSFYGSLQRTSSFDTCVHREVLQPTPMYVDRTNIGDSPLARVAVTSGVPIFVFVEGTEIDAFALDFATSCAGLAHVLVVSKDFYENADDPETQTMFAYWRAGGVESELFTGPSGRFGALRKLLASTKPDLDFYRVWREIQLAPKSHTLPVPSSLGETKAADSEVVLGLQLQLELAEKIAAKATNDLEEYVREFDETRIRWSKRLDGVQRFNAAVVARGAKEGINAEDLILELDLEADVDSEFDSLSRQTLGCLVFTSNAGRSWKTAKKRMGSNAIMTNALIQLAKLSMEYRSKGANLGKPKDEFAREFGLELIEFDDKLPQKTFVYDGKVYSQENHIRADASRESFDTLGRIHLDFDAVNLRVIVNHVGGKQYRNDK